MTKLTKGAAYARALANELPGDLSRVAPRLGLEIREVNADGFDGALLRAREVVADRLHVEAIDAEERKAAGEVIGVRVDDLAEQQLGPDRQKLSLHEKRRNRDADGGFGWHGTC